MQVEKISGPVRQSLKTCGRSGSRPRLQAPCKRSPPYLCQSVHIAAFGTPPATRSHDDLDKLSSPQAGISIFPQTTEKTYGFIQTGVHRTVCTLRG